MRIFLGHIACFRNIRLLIFCLPVIHREDYSVESGTKNNIIFNLTFDRVFFFIFFSFLVKTIGKYL